MKRNIVVRVIAAIIVDSLKTSTIGVGVSSSTIKSFPFKHTYVTIVGGG
jgi:7-cyano-7-deazaguanine synthase in queuosine biosynthesis